MRSFQRRTGLLLIIKRRVKWKNFREVLVAEGDEEGLLAGLLVCRADFEGVEWIKELRCET